MKQFFAPLSTFVGGMFMLLIMMIVWPAVDTALVGLASGSSFWTGWGWSWLMTTGVVKWLAFGIAFLTVCFWTGVVFLKTKPKF